MLTRSTATKRGRSRRGVIRGVGLRALLVGTLTAVPLPAAAGSVPTGTNVTVSGGRLSITAGDLSDDMSVTAGLDGSLVVRNSNDTLIGTVACQKVDANAVRCPGAGITGLHADLLGGDDTLRNDTSLPMRAVLGPGTDTFFGGSARDTVSGGSGGDTMRGGNGNDVLDGDSGDDSALGGSGDDLCHAEIRESCER